MTATWRPMLAVLAGLCAGLALWHDRVAAAEPASKAMRWQDAHMLAEVLQRVRENYVDSVDDHALMNQAAAGMVDGLDQYSELLSADEYAELQATTSGEYAGVGVEIEAAATGLRVVRVMDDSPAARAGLRAGEIITAIDGQAVTASGVDAASEHLRGPVGTSVELLLRDSPTVTRRALLAREEVALPSVSGQSLAPGIAYLRIASFTDATAEEAERELAALTGSDSEALQGVVIDLRNNPGGVLDAAVELADDFLDSGTIVSADGRAASARFRAEAQPGDVAAGAPIAVLVNGASASAAEILAAALSDNGRATLIGQKTYGKGSVQSIIPLSDGSALKLTTSRYFTPKGISINGIGIQPAVSLDGAERAPEPLDAIGHAPSLALRDPAIGVALATLRHSPRRTAHEAPAASHPHS